MARRIRRDTEQRIGILSIVFKRGRDRDHDASQSNGTVGLGSKVTVDFDGEDDQYTIVEQFQLPSGGLISNESPIGRALGKRAGDKAVVETPAAR